MFVWKIFASKQSSNRKGKYNGRKDDYSPHAVTKPDSDNQFIHRGEFLSGDVSLSSAVSPGLKPHFK